MVQLYYFSGRRPNFGDELNPWLWPKLLPHALEGDGTTILLGIGTLLNDRVPAGPSKLVFGSGFGYGRPPRLDDGKWRIYCVRGPMTAEALGLDREKAICDPGILVRTVQLQPKPAARGTAFMPHWESVDIGRWDVACREAGIRFIDPCSAVNDILAAIAGADLLITEAMHGAVVADALRTPWIPVRPLLRMHQAKWDDWCSSMELAYRPRTLPPSSFAERIRADYRLRRQRLGRAFRRAAALKGVFSSGRITSPAARSSPSTLPSRTGPGPALDDHVVQFMEQWLERPIAAAYRRLPQPVVDRINSRFIEDAARNLQRIAGTPACLSKDAVLDRATERLLQRLDVLRADLAALGQAPNATAAS